MQNGRVRKMKYIVKSISIGVENVVAQRIPDKNAVPPQIAAPAAALIHRDLEMARKLFFLGKAVIKRRKARIVRGKKPAPGLGDVFPNDKEAGRCFAQLQECGIESRNR